MVALGTSAVGAPALIQAPAWDCDAHFSSFRWFRRLREQGVNASTLRADVACDVRPHPLPTRVPGSLGGPAQRLVVVGLATHLAEHDVVDEVENALRFTGPSTGLVVHLDAALGDPSPALHARLKGLASLSGDRLLLSPHRVNPRKFTGTIALAHLVNFASAWAIG